MSDIAISHIEPIAAHILSTSLGQPIRLQYVGQIRNRSDICRFDVLDGPPTAPSGVVVKVVSASVQSDTVRLRWLFFNEWAGLTLLQQLMVEPPLMPRFYGGDRATGMLVMEDLGTRPTLWDELQGRDAQSATTQLVALATTFGRMHAHTIGKQPHFEQIRAVLTPDHSPMDLDVYDWIRLTLEATTATLGIPFLPTVMQDLALLKQRLAEPDPFQVYTQSDPSPGNCLFVTPSMRLLDFGAGTYRHAFVDFPPPWCWQKIPRSVMRLMIDAYQMALSEGCAAAADPVRFAQGIVEGCAYWSMTLLKDWPLAEVAVDAGMRQNLLQILESFAELSQQAAYLESLGAMITAIVEVIGRYWPMDTYQSAYYAAFQIG